MISSSGCLAGRREGIESRVPGGPMPRLTRLSRSIAGRTAIVTGAASGMGRATAHLFADEGERVAVVDRDAAGVARVIEEIEKAGGAAAGFALDVSDTARIIEFTSQVRDRLGPVDILINNAGIAAGAPVNAQD